jgi:hypothetical protein
MSTVTNNYYVTHRESLLADFDSIFSYALFPMSELCSTDDAREIVAETRRGFEALIPDIPYIGGRDNAMTDNLVMSAWFLAFFRAMEARGYRPAETYEVIYEVVEQWLKRRPPSFVQMMGALRLSPLYVDSLKHHAERSQRREFPGDWVYVYIEGDGAHFDYGLDYLECGICKFYRDQNAASLIPYMCALDYPMTRAYGLDLKRTTTLGGGGQKCDFKIKGHRHVEDAGLNMQDMGVP